MTGSDAKPARPTAPPSPLLAYNDAGQLLSETNSAGTLAGIRLTNGYDQYLRRTNLALLNQSTPLASESCAYDSASRLQTVSDGNNNAATYSYLANSPLVSQIAFTNSGSWRMTTTKQYDLLNRLTQISTVDSGLRTVDSHSYTYSPANQRVRTTLADGSYWLYTYDSLGQVISGRKILARPNPGCRAAIRVRL